MSTEQIETKIHNILLDIDHTNHDYEDQAVIIAEATGIYMQRKSARTASKIDPRMEESEIIDCILQAMTDSSNNEVKYASIDLDSSDDGEINYEDVLKSLRFCSKGFGDMDILNEDDVDVFFPKESDSELFVTEDVYNEVHDPDLYEVPGFGKHRSDSIIR